MGRAGRGGAALPLLLLGACAPLDLAPSSALTARLEAPAQRLRAQVGADGTTLEGAHHTLTVRSRGLGRLGAVAALGGAELEPLPCGEDPDAPRCGAWASLRRDGVTEWWEAGPEGLRQSWSLAGPPEGAGPLALEVAVDGEVLEVHPDQVLLRGADGGRWRAGGLKAWDAEGAALAARFEPRAGGYAVVVDADGARYPVVIDPLYTEEGAQRDGVLEEGLFGWAAEAVGDVNGDGYGDVLVGAPNADASVGRAYLFHGGAEGLEAAPARTLHGAAADDRFGFAVAAAGDLNQDGYADVAVGAFGSAAKTGRVYIHLGGPEGLGEVAHQTLPGGAAGAQAGRALAGAGDVNGDGFPDLVVGAPGADNRGQVQIFYGGDEGLSAARVSTFSGDETGESLGWSVAGAGDVNGDGYDDVLVGAAEHNSGAGRVVLLLGGPEGAAHTPAEVAVGSAPGDELGWAVTGAGDLNQDGYADVAIGAPGAGAGAGRVTVLLGGPDGLSADPAFTQDGGAEDNLGWSLAGPGDLDRDGFDDLVLSAPAGEGGYGWLAVVPGSAEGVQPEALLRVIGERKGAGLGRPVRPAGDLNGDGHADLLVGAPYTDDSTGALLIYYGYADADADGYTSVEDCDDHNSAVYPFAVDIGGDGVDQNCDGEDRDTRNDDPEWATPRNTDPCSDSCGEGCHTGRSGAGWVGVLLGAALLRRRGLPAT